MTRRADTILQILAEGRTLQQRVMIVLAHPDDEKIGMRTQLCQLRDALLLQATDGAPHEGHSDHDAGAFVVRAAGRLIASNRRSRSAIIEMTAYHAEGPSLAGLLGGFLHRGALPAHPQPQNGQNQLTHRAAGRRQRVDDPTRRNPGFYSLGRADLLADPSGSPRMKASVLARAS